MQRHRVTSTPAPEVVEEVVEDVESDKECSDEEDFNLLIGFDPEKAKEKLLNLSNSIRVTISPEQQKELTIEVGVNLSQQNPWKQVSKKFFIDQLVSDTYEMEVLREKLKEVDDDVMLLIGYVAEMSDENLDTFVIIYDENTSKDAGEIIKRLEACERRKFHREIVKYPKPYESKGSELEVDNYVKIKRTNLVDVELQSVYPMRYSNANFGLRLSDDVRDGYVELIPNKNAKIENVVRKMIDRAVQSGPLKVTQEQQTDPTFPTNAWSQYIYDMDEEIKRTRDAKSMQTDSIVPESEVDDSSAIFKRKKSKEVAPVEQKIVEPTVSKQVEDLLEILDFNRIDMYRNDYPFISKQEILKYQTPYIEEVCCFVNVAKCKGRHVTSIDWHPEYSGVCVVSYGYNLKSKIINEKNEIDVVKRTVIELNPVLIWSFDNHLHPKLELETMREISCISFCPYDGNIIVGGCVSGQIIIWDLSKRMEKVEIDEIFSPERQRVRQEIRDFMKWSQFDESNKIVLPSAISNIDKSHEGAVTSIKWMATNYQCTSKGLLKEDREHGTQYRQFVTTSIDGNILFWSLDWEPSAEDKKIIKKPNYKVDLPPELKQESSPFKEIDLMFSYHYKLSINKPILGFTFNEGEFLYNPLEKVRNDITIRVHHEVKPVRKTSFNPKMVVGTSTGEVVLCGWDGHDFSQGAILDPKHLNQDHFSHVHDGPVTHVVRNPFFEDIFISIGGFIFALWRDDYKECPILYRSRKSRLMGCQWSLDRPSVFFLIFENGILEIWDLNSRIDIPSLDLSLAGNLLSEILQHKLTLSRRLIAIADHNTNLRVFQIPLDFVNPAKNEKEIFEKFVNDEIERMRNQEQWKLDWFEANKDIVEARKTADMEVTDEKEKRERMRREIEEKRAQMAEAEAKKLAKKQAKKLTYDLPERLEKKWNDQNYKRLLSIMMMRKKVDRELLEKQTKILKDRMKYNEEKKLAIKENFSKIDNDLSTIRARLIPVEQHETSREELVKESVDKIYTPDLLNFKAIENDCLQIIKHQPEMNPMTLFDIQQRCKENRDLINLSLGGGSHAKFERYRRERMARISRVSSVSIIPRSLTQSVDFKDSQHQQHLSIPETPTSMQ